MPREFKLPDVGEGVAEGEIVEWLVEEGDPVSEDQPVAEVETDKAVVEVPSPVNGTVQQIHYDAGAIVPVGEVIVTFAVEGEAAAEGEATAEAESAGAEPSAEAGQRPDEATGSTPRPEAGDGESVSSATEAEADVEPSKPAGRVFASPSVRRLAREKGVSLQDVEGTGPSGRITEQDIRAAAQAHEERSAAEATGGEGATADVESPAGGSGAESRAEATGAEAPPSGTEPAGTAPPQQAGRTAGQAQVQEQPQVSRERTLATPKTRGVARELDVDLDQIPAVEEREGEAFVTEAAVREYAEAQQAAQAADAAAVTKARDGEDRVEYRGVRRTIGERMEESKYTAPHVSHHDTAEVSKLVETRAALKERAEARDVKLTYMPFVMKAVVAGLKEFPFLNSSLDEEAEEIVRKYYYNIGVAVATDAGLMVPVVKHVDRKGILELAAEVNDLAQQARERTIALEDLQGSTFSITNFGAIGGEYATPILNYPEVGILGLGAIEERPVVEDGEVVARPTLPLSLSIDHRVVDGAIAAEFTNTVMEYLENPTLLLLE